LHLLAIYDTNHVHSSLYFIFSFTRPAHHRDLHSFPTRRSSDLNEIKPGASVEEASEIVKSDHPSRFEGALEYTAKAMADAKRFIVEHDLATLPPNEELNVIETPSYLRHVIPFAAYNAPARFEACKQGFYMVTPVEDK